VVNSEGRDVRTSPVNFFETLGSELSILEDVGFDDEAAVGAAKSGLAVA